MSNEDDPATTSTARLEVDWKWTGSGLEMDWKWTIYKLNV